MAKKNKKEQPGTTYVDSGNDTAGKDIGLPKKDLFRIDEVASYFDVARSTIYLWIDHGILSAEKYKGTIRVPREAIINCRLANQLHPLE